MSFEEDGAIRIPIEFIVEDLKEKEKIKEDLDKMEKKQKKLKDTSSKQPSQTQVSEERGGIFGGREGGKAPTFRDKTSRAPSQKKNEFKELKKKFSKLEGAQKEADKVFGQLQKNSQQLFGGVGGAAKSALKFAPFIAQALIIIGFLKTLRDKLLEDGGLFDRRLKILIAKQFLKLTKRRETAQLSSIEKVLRVTTTSGLRGPTNQVVSTFDPQKRGIKLFDTDLEAINKSVLP